MRMESHGPSWLFDWLNCFPCISSCRVKNPDYSEGLTEQTPRLQVSKCGTVISLEGRFVDNIAKLGPLPIGREVPAELAGIIVGILDMIHDGDGDGVAHATRSWMKTRCQSLLHIIDVSPMFSPPSPPPVNGPFEGLNRLQCHHLALMSILRNQGWSTTAQYHRAMLLQFVHYRFCKTSKGLFGFVPVESRVGDVVAFLRGGSAPFILRPVDEGYFTLVGEGYVYGLMYWQNPQVKQVPIQTIRLR